MLCGGWRKKKWKIDFVFEFHWMFFVALRRGFSTMEKEKLKSITFYREFYRNFFINLLNFLNTVNFHFNFLPRTSLIIFFTNKKNLWKFKVFHILFWSILIASISTFIYYFALVFQETPNKRWKLSKTTLNDKTYLLRTILIFHHPNSRGIGNFPLGERMKKKKILSRNV